MNRGPVPTREDAPVTVGRAELVRAGQTRGAPGGGVQDTGTPLSGVGPLCPARAGSQTSVPEGPEGCVLCGCPWGRWRPSQPDSAPGRPGPGHASRGQAQRGLGWTEQCSSLRGPAWPSPRALAPSPGSRGAAGCPSAGPCSPWGRGGGGGGGPTSCPRLGGCAPGDRQRAISSFSETPLVGRSMRPPRWRLVPQRCQGSDRRPPPGGSRSSGALRERRQWRHVLALGRHSSLFSGRGS